MTQPKDMEQLKIEAREKIYSTFVDEDVMTWIEDFINKAHLSGRESMKVECVEGARAEMIDIETNENSEIAHNDACKTIVSALKKIKP